MRYNGTHTIFPLSLDKVLILTNLSWVRELTEVFDGSAKAAMPAARRLPPK